MEWKLKLHGTKKSKLRNSSKKEKEKSNLESYEEEGVPTQTQTRNIYGVGWRLDMYYSALTKAD